MPMFGAPRTARRAIAVGGVVLAAELEPVLAGRAGASGRGSAGGRRPSGRRSLGSESGGSRHGPMLLSGRMRRLLLAALAAALAAPASGPRGRPDHAARRRAGRRALHRPDGRARHRRRGVRRRRSSTSSAPTGRLTARILVRVSGPAVDATGVGPGFSGSPVLCPAPTASRATIGAISETIGEYGGKTVLATPIEAMLAPAAACRPAALPAIPGARPLAAPLTIAGLRPALAASFARAAAQGRPRAHQLARRLARDVRSAAARARARRPSSASSSGAISVGALGTVTLRRRRRTSGSSATRIDAAGRRSLFLQDAFVHTVINNPLAVDDVATYKLASPGNDIGTITSDGPSAVVGQTGRAAAELPAAGHRDATCTTGRTTGSLTHIADEGDVGRPSGISPLGLAGAAAVAEAAGAILNGHALAPERRHVREGHAARSAPSRCASATPTPSTARCPTRSPAPMSPT